MDFKSMQALFWLLLFVFLIFVPGSTLNAIESKAKPAAAITTEIGKTIRTTTTAAVAEAVAATTKASSLLKDTINDKTFQKFQSTTQAPLPITTRRTDVPEIATTTTTTTTSPSTKETTAITTKSPTFISTRALSTEGAASASAAPVSLVGKATNVDFSIGTKASLNSSKSRKDSDPTATATAIITTATKSATRTAAAVELSAPVDAVRTSTSTEQVIIAAEVDEAGEVALLMATLTPITANNDKALNNADNRIINDEDNNNNNNNSNSANHYYDSSLSNSSGENNKNTQVDNSTQSPMKLQPRPLQKPKIYHDNRSEQQRQQHVWVHEEQTQQLQQQQYQAAHFKQQYTRQVQQALTMTTTITALSSGAAAALDSNLIVADKNIEENELQTEDKSNLKTASMPFETNDAAAVAATTSSSSSVALTTKPPASTTATESTTTARRRAMATTTLRPTPAIDDYQTITSQAGTHAYLPCNVKQLVKKPISWLRVRDGHILTVDQTTFIADQRFQSIYTSNPERWSLQIKYVQLKDAGTYECQVSTEPKASAIVSLRIVEPKTELIGESTRHVKAGSQVKLRCIISQALEPPLFINWFYNQKQIYLHNRRGWRTEIERIDLPQEMPLTTTTTTATTATTARATTAITPKLATGSDTATTGQRSSPYAFSMSSALSPANDGSAESVSSISAAKTTTAATSSATSASSSSTMAAAAADVKQITTASLIIPAVEKLDSGNYTCSPSNSAPRTVVLHVLNGEYSASAITSGVSGNVNIGHRSQQWHFHWHNTQTTAATTTTLLTLLWIIKFLFAKSIWNCNSHSSSTRRVRSENGNNWHRNNRNGIQAVAQFAACSNTNGHSNSTYTNTTMELGEKT